MPCDRRSWAFTFTTPRSIARPMTETLSGRSNSSGKSVTTSMRKRGDDGRSIGLDDLFWRIVDHHHARLQVDPPHHLPKCRHEHLAGGADHPIDLVLPHSEHLVKRAQLAAGRIGDGQAHKLMPVIAAGRKRSSRHL